MARRRPRTMWSLETLGRTRLSKYFFMREFLYSEIAEIHGIQNIPDDVELALEAGQGLCQNLLDPLVETFGAVSVRSGFRAVAVNEFGNKRGLNCARNTADYAGHIWDRRDHIGRIGACATVVLPWFADQYAHGRHWHDLAWWMHDHTGYSTMRFFPKLCAFNLTWHDRKPLREIRGWIGGNSVLLRAGETPVVAQAARRVTYADFPPFRGVQIPMAEGPHRVAIS